MNQKTRRQRRQRKTDEALKGHGDRKETEGDRGERQEEEETQKETELCRLHKGLLQLSSPHCLLFCLFLFRWCRSVSFLFPFIDKRELVATGREAHVYIRTFSFFICFVLSSPLFLRKPMLLGSFKDRKQTPSFAP